VINLAARFATGNGRGRSSCARLQQVHHLLVEVKGKVAELLVEVADDPNSVVVKQ
jgi:hypothetical protein